MPENYKGRQVKPSEKPKNNIISTSQDVSKHIKYARTVAGKSQEDIAEQCGIGLTTLKTIETNCSTVKFETVLHVTNTLKLKLAVNPNKGE